MDQKRIFLKIVIFDYRRHVKDENFNYSKKCRPNPGFCSKLSFLTTADMLRVKISTFPQMLARWRILLKIAIFDHRGHVKDENCNFSKSFGPIQDLNQKLSFLTTTDMFRMKISIFPKILAHSTTDISRMNISIFPKILAQSRILLKIVVFWPPQTYHGWKFQSFQKCWPD